MTEYRVRWSKRIMAADPREAAEGIRANFHTRITAASVYEVQDTSDQLGARWRSVDLGRGADTDGDVWEFSHRALFRMAERILLDGGDAKDILAMLEKPWHYLDELTQAIMEDEFNKVSHGADEAAPS